MPAKRKTQVRGKSVRKDGTPRKYAKFTPERRAQFLKLVAAWGNMSYACDQVGITRENIYRLRGKDPEFANAIEEAKNAAVEVLEKEAWRRATGFELSEEDYNGDGVLQHVKVVRRNSDQLLQFLLRALKPSMYRDTLRVENVDVTQLTDEELESLVRTGLVRTSSCRGAGTPPTKADRWMVMSQCSSGSVSSIWAKGTSLTSRLAMLLSSPMRNSKLSWQARSQRE